MLEIKKNILLAPYTTFRVGGRAKFFVETKNREETIEAIKLAKQKKIKYFILGSGSNILIDDKGYSGMIIKPQDGNCKIQNDKIICDAGIKLSKLVRISLDNNLTGLEWAVGIPGSVGGAIAGNAGSHGGFVAIILESAEIFDGEKIRILKNNDFKFGYRTSIFKKSKRLKSALILSAVFKLKKGDKEKSQKLIKKYLLERKTSQPSGFSAGSVFKDQPDNFAGKMIEECGLKGLKIGDAQISPKHGNFIINTGKAKSSDILALIATAKRAVKKKMGKILKEEIVIVK